MQIDYHVSILEGESTPEQKLTAADAILNLLRSQAAHLLQDPSYEKLIALSRGRTDPKLQKQLAEILAYGAYTKTAVEVLLLQCYYSAERTPTNAGILHGSTLRLLDTPAAADEREIRLMVRRGHRFLPTEKPDIEDAQWTRSAIHLLAHWMAAKINQKRPSENTEKVLGLGLLTPVYAGASVKEIRQAQKDMIDILGGESIRDWEKALRRTADARPAATEVYCRFALSLLPVKQEENHEALGKKVTDIIRAAFNRVETPTFSDEQSKLLMEQVRAHHMPAVDFLSAATDDHDVLVMSDSLPDEEYAAFTDLMINVYDEAGFSHIALPVAPEEAAQFDEFLGSAPEKSSEALFDDPEWALNHLRQVLLSWKAHGIPLVLAGSNPSLAGELIISNEASRLRNILKDNERAKVIALSLGFMNFHEFKKCTTKGPGKGKTTIELLEDNIGKGKTSAVHLLSQQGRWTEEGEQGEIGDLCNSLGLHEHFGFKCEGTLLESAKEHRGGKWTYGQGYDAFIVLGDKDDDKKRNRRPRRRSPKGKPLVTT